jgi:transposase-like protein
MNETTQAKQVPQMLLEAIRYFSDPDVCLDFIARMRWPDGVTCPWVLPDGKPCDSKEVCFITTRRVWKCKRCKKQFSVKAGTIFEYSPIGLDKWLMVYWMLANCKNGVSSYEIHRAIGVTQKTAWFMLHRVRYALKNGTFEKQSGEVEADETFIGGKEKNKHKDKKQNAGRGTVGKTVVMGTLERGEPYLDKWGEEQKTASQVRLNIVPDTQKATLQPEVEKNVAEGSALFTDAASAYQGLCEKYGHEVVDHAVKYAEGKVHTNGIENFWSLVDRMLDGTYVSVEPEHLLAYLDEQAFRFNERKGCDAVRFMKALQGFAGKRLTYRELIGNPQGIDSPDPLRGGPRAD